MKHTLQMPNGIAALAGAALLVPTAAAPALAQAGPTQMPMMDGPMIWGMEVIHLLGIIVLILGAAALVKYLFFR